MKMIVVGCGRVGSGLAQSLSRSGHSVTVIDSDPAAFELLDPSFRGDKVEGVGFDRDVLAKARIDRADALAAFTSSDESNAVIARMGREIYHVPKVVARLYDHRKADIYKRLGIQTISSTSWGIRRASDLLCYSPLNTVFSMGSGDVELVELEVPPLMVGRRVSDLTASGEISVTGILRENRTILPTAGTMFQRNDLIYIAVSTSSSGRLRQMLGLNDGRGM